MQAAPAVGWDLMSFSPHLPMAEKVLILYLFVITATSPFKLMSVLRTFWSVTRAPGKAAIEPARAAYRLQVSANEIQSLRRLAHITLLVTTLVVALLLRADFALFSEQKILFAGFFNGALAEVLSVFAAGVCVSATIYGAYAFCEGLLQRIRMRRQHAESVV